MELISTMTQKLIMNTASYHVKVTFGEAAVDVNTLQFILQV